MPQPGAFASAAGAGRCTTSTPVEIAFLLRFQSRGSGNHSCVLRRIGGFRRWASEDVLGSLRTNVRRLDATPEGGLRKWRATRSGRTATPPLTQRNLAGLSVEALDGSIGKIDEATQRGRLELHRRRHRPMDLRQEGHAPGRRLKNVDLDNEKVYVNRTKDQIKDAPEYDDAMICGRGLSRQLSKRLGSYYGPGGRATATTIRSSSSSPRGPGASTGLGRAGTQRVQ